MQIQSKVQDLTDEYCLEITLTDSRLQILVIDYNLKKVNKYITVIELEEHAKLLMEFGTAEELYKLVKTYGNYSYCPTEKKFSIRWRTVGQNYQRENMYHLPMIAYSLTQMQALKFENMLLKKRLSSYREKSTINEIKENVVPIQISAKKFDQPSESQVQQIPFPMTIEDLFSQVQQKYEILNEISMEDKTQLEDSSNMPKKTKIIHKNQKFSTLKMQSTQTTEKGGENKEVKKRGRKKKSQIIEKQSQQKNQTQKSPEKVMIKFPNGDYYHGEIKNNLYHGLGRYFSHSNGTFEGFWQKGKANGQGTSIDAFGNKHVGMYRNGSRNGQGVDEYANGQRYEGNFENDCKTGFGKYVYKNGDYYEGEWKDDLYNGFGTQCYRDGSRYQGKWCSDEKDREGIFFDVEGKRWKQVWEKGAKISQYKLD